MNKIVLTTKYTEGGMQMRHVFDELEAQGLKPKMLFKKDHDEIIFGAPTVEPQEKTGHWEKIKSGDTAFPESIVCSRCGGENSYFDFGIGTEPIGKSFVKSKYCPNCGAKMDKRDAE